MESPEMPETSAPKSIMSRFAGSSRMLVRANVLGSPSSAAEAGWPGKVELMNTLAPEAMLMPVSLRPPPVPRNTLTPEIASEACPGVRMDTHVARAASCLVKPMQVSPLKELLEALTLHEALPTHASDTTEKELVALQDGAGMSERAVSRSDTDALTKSTAADRAETFGVPKDAYGTL
jgi:hypothetical protein